MIGTRLYLMGIPRLEREGVPVRWPDGGREPLALLAYLALLRHPQRREALTALLWPGEQPRQGCPAADVRLDQALDVLNRVLGPDVVVGEGGTEGTVRLERGALWLDVDHFWRLLETCGAHGHALDEACPRCLPLLAEAIDHYRGDLTCLGLPESEPFRDWLLYERTVLRDEARRALHQLVRGYSNQGEYELAIAYARRWLQMDPWREQAHRTLMTLYAWTGDLAAAARQYEECTLILRQELDQAPEWATRELHAALQSGQVPPPPTWGPVLHSGAPVHACAPLRPLNHSHTPFVNRERELNVLAGFLSRASACRLLTLIGPPGIGKSRLALRAADQARHSYPDGVYALSLGTLPAADLLLTAIADALGLAFHGRADPTAQLLDYCRDKRMLLVLDDFEHLADAPAGASALELLADLLRAAPQLFVLTTAHRPLGLDGECAWTVGGMLWPHVETSVDAGSDPSAAVDATEETPDYGALRLFMESVQRRRMPLPLSAAERLAAARICHLVEGLPLGLEMASAWAASIPLDEIRAGIERVLQQPPQAQPHAPQQVLQAVFEFSWQQLSAAEQRVLAQLSVFQGAFGRQAAEQVAGASPFMLAALVAKSLLRGHPMGRFDMHEWVRELAALKLAQMPGADVSARDAHCVAYSQMLHRLEPDLRGAAQGRALDEIAADVDNVRAAWRWAVEHDCANALSLALEGLHLYYYARGWMQEGQSAFADALEGHVAAHGTARDPWLYARLLVRAGRFSGRLGLYAQARARLDEGLALCQQLEGQVPQADLQREWALAHLARSAVLRGEGARDEAEWAAQRALDLYRACGDRTGIAHALGILGMLCGSRGQVEEAQAMLGEALALYRELGDPYGQASALNDLGNVAAGSGHLDEARAHYDRCLLLRRQIGDLWGAGILLNNLGYLAHLREDHAEAVEFLQQGLAIQREIGDRYHIANCLSNLGAAHRALGQCQVAAGYLYEGLELAHEIGAQPLVLEISAEIGVLLAEREVCDRERAAELLSFVSRHPLTDQWTAQRVEGTLSELTPTLLPEVWTAAQARAQAETLESIVRLVLDDESLPQAA